MPAYQKIVLFAFLLSGFLQGNAQVLKQALGTPSRSSPTSSLTSIGGFNRFYDADLSNPVEGSPYANDEFVKGSIYHSRGVHRNIDMRLNVYANQIEYKVNDSIWVVDASKLIQKVVMGDHTLVVNLGEEKGKQGLRYYYRLDSGKVTLLEKKNARYQEAQYGKAIEGNVPAKYFGMASEYFIKIGEEPLIKIQSMKKLIEDLPDHKPEMEQFAKKEKISTNKPKELIKFIHYYNSL